ncbi:LPXTG cell wall anchor domain-containing protein [Microbacterium hominis]|uniref:LPXTG cell wall anchor domain-containing protein n=1 Tax=Microbacterium hominis TaxID=162426 RepID=UPI001CC3252D|nr:LPXTG cell wall anchor domain-containing protein [Microbacterium hominis]
MSDEPGQTDPSIALSATEVRAGEALTVTGSDFAVDRVEVGIASTYRALAQADVVDGAFSAQVTVPSDLEPGSHTIQVRVDGEVVASAAITVLAAAGTDPGTGSGTPTPTPTATTAGGSTLPATGGTPDGLVAGVLVGLLLMAAGGAVVLRRRRLN